MILIYCIIPSQTKHTLLFFLFEQSYCSTLHLKDSRYWFGQTSRSFGQVKQNIIYNIRPITWYSERSTYKPFESRFDFVSALHETITMYSQEKEASNWLEKVKSKYVEQVGHPL